MPTSMLPCDFALVTSQILEAARKDPRIVCNLRPEQRDPSARIWSEDRRWIDDPLTDFFRLHVDLPTRLAIHFQSYGSEERGTVIGTIERTFSTALVLKDRPKGMKEFHDNPLWAPFVLAVAQVSDTAADEFREDSGEFFLEIVRQHGMPSS